MRPAFVFILFFGSAATAYGQTALSPASFSFQERLARAQAIVENEEKARRHFSLNASELPTTVYGHDIAPTDGLQIYSAHDRDWYVRVYGDGHTGSDLTKQEQTLKAQRAEREQHDRARIEEEQERRRAVEAKLAAAGDCKVTYEGFQRLRIGMSYIQVAEILGCYGTEMSRTGLAGTTTVMYDWASDASLGSNMAAMFQGDRMINKAQLGLK